MTENKKPPDISNDNIFRVIKCPLKAVLKDYNNIQPIIEDAVKDINKFVIFGYQFIRLYLLDKFNNNQELPTINKQFVLDVIKTISSPNTKRGQKTKQETRTRITTKNKNKTKTKNKKK